MERIQALNPEAATGRTEELFAAVQAKLGRTPNLMRTLGHSPAALEGYLNLGAALATGSLSPKLREQIALVVAETNGCDYCLAAHSAVGRMVGLSLEEILDSRRGEATDASTRVALAFSRLLVTERGHVSDGDLARVRNAGFTDGEIAELIANVALNLFSNYFNHVAGTKVDFPAASPLREQPHPAFG